MRNESLESDYRGEQRKRYFEDPNYRKWSDVGGGRKLLTTMVITVNGHLFVSI